MFVPTLPEARFLVLSDADLPAALTVALAAERWGGTGPAPVIVPAWWRSDADSAMPLVHSAVARQASLFAIPEPRTELVVESSADNASQLSGLLLAAVRLAAREGCDAVLFPVRAMDWCDAVDATAVAREIDRAELVGRLASLDAPSGVSVITPVVDLDDEQTLDLARDLGVPAECCWWSGGGADPAAREAASRWRGLGSLAVASGGADRSMIRSA